jgi:hypothetical protein
MSFCESKDKSPQNDKPSHDKRITNKLNREREIFSFEIYSYLLTMPPQCVIVKSLLTENYTNLGG